MNPKRLFQVDNWLKTPADHDVIKRWTRTPPNEVPLAARYTLEMPTNLAAPGEAWDFLALGDTGDADAAGPGEAPQDAVAKEMARDAAAPVGNGNGRLTLHLGDVIYMTGEHRLYERNFRRPYAPFLTPESTVGDLVFRQPFLPVPGNHDYYDLGGWAKWVARIPLVAPGLRAVAHEIFAFGLPEGGSDMGRAYMEAFVSKEPLQATLTYAPGKQTRLPNRYYQFTVGNVDFFALDSNTLDAPPPYANTQQIHEEAHKRMETMKTKARALDKLLQKQQQQREEQRREEREQFAKDTTKRTYLQEPVAALSQALQALQTKLTEARQTAAGSTYNEALQTVNTAQARWTEGTKAIDSDPDEDDYLRAMDTLDDAGDKICRALLSVEVYLGTLPGGSGARSHLTSASDAVERAQSAYATASEPQAKELDAYLRTLSEEALDIQREMALEQRRVHYSEADYDRAQYEWLDAALAASERDRPGNWRVVYLHHPLYTTIGNHCERPDVIGLRENLLALLQARERVHLVLSGHSHAFEWFRSDALPNTGIFVTGGGGQLTLRPSVLEPGRLRRHRDRYIALRDAGITECASGGAGPEAPEDGASGPLYHYLKLTASLDSLEVRPVGVRWLRGGGFRREEPMPVYHTAYMPAPPDSPPFATRRLESVVVKRGQSPEARWAE